MIVTLGGFLIASRIGSSAVGQEGWSIRDEGTKSVQDLTQVRTRPRFLRTSP